MTRSMRCPATPSFSRRQFLKVGSAAVPGLTLASALQAEEERGRGVHNVIMVWLGGGPSTIDMWDLKPEAESSIRGPFEPIATSVEGLQIGEHMPQLAKAMHLTTLIRSMHHSIPAHGPGTRYLQTGNKPSPALEHPSLGSLVSKLAPAPAHVPPYVSFAGDVEGAAAGYLGAGYNPYVAQRSGVRGLSLPQDVTPQTFTRRTRILEVLDGRFSIQDDVSGVARAMDGFQEKAIEILRADRTRQAFDLRREPTALRERYGNTQLGRTALVARRLIEAGVRFVTISSGGWDTHGNNFNSLQNRLLPPLDRALATLILDLDERGLLDTTAVYCTGEFGRTPRVNGNAGRDHWARSMSVLLSGSRFARGKVFGETTETGEVPAESPCTPTDLSATIIRALGMDPATELRTSSGRPIQAFREGKVLDALLG